MLLVVDEHPNKLSNKKTTEQQIEPVTQLQPHDSLSNKQMTINKGLLNICGKKGSCDNSQMTVETSGNNAKGKRYCCLYCLERFPKLPRHLESVHKEEPEVKALLALPKSKIFF